MTRSLMPVILPSLVAPSSTSSTWARPCCIEIMVSQRLSTYRTGLSSLSAIAASATCSGYVAMRAPNPPPTVGTVTRIFSGSRSSEPASAP